MASALSKFSATDGRRAEQRSQRMWPLVATLAGGAALITALWEIDGPPRVANGAPDWSRIREVLAGSEVADADVIVVAATLAWLALGYLACSIGLRLLVVLADRLSGGASWARAALSLSNLVTLPAVRRIVDGGVAGTLLLASWLPEPSRIAIAAEPVAVVVMSPPLHVAAADGSEPWAALDLQQPVRFVEYTVVRGDYLWDIARRFYGDGSRFVEIFEVNQGRVMLEGEHLTDPRLIRVGWVLRIPLPAQNLSIDGDTVSYRVRRGDHLWDIAERLLGDGFRWVEIWEQNRGRELSGGRLFTNPDLLEPGLLLELPIAISGVAQPESPAAGLDPIPTDTATAATASPGPTVTPIDPIDVAASAVQPEREGGWSWHWPSLPRPILVTASGFVVIGSTALFVQRLLRSGRLRVPGAVRASREGPGDAGRVTLATQALAHALADYGFADSQPLLVEESGRRLEFTVRCPVGDAEALIARRHDLARRLACEVDAELIGTTRVTVTLSGFQRLAALLGDDAEAASTALVIPVGAAAGGIVYLNLAVVGTITVAGSESERRQLLRSWISTLATTHAPQQLALRVDAPVAELLGSAVAIPHSGGALPTDSAALLEELEELIQTRSAGGGERAVVAIIAPAPEHEAAVAGLLRDGPRAGVFIVRAMPAKDGVANQDASGASVVFSRLDEAVDDETAVGERGAIALTVGRDRPLLLDPVTVRRDSSARWGAAAESESRDPFAPSIDGGDDLATGTVESPTRETPEPAPFDELPDEFPLDPDDEPGPLDAELGEGAGAPDDEVAGHEVDAAPVEPGWIDGDAAAANESATRAVPPPNTPVAVAERPAAATTRQSALFADLEDSDGGVTGSAPRVSVQCLGGLQVSVGGAPIERWPLEKSRELLALLVAHGGTSVAREVVAEALWPGCDWDASIKHTLSNTASTLRSTLRAAVGEDEIQPLVAARQRFQLPSALFSVDLDSFDATLRRAAGLSGAEALEQYEQALRLYAGDFLDGEFFEWLDPYRMDYRQRLFDAARKAAAIAEGRSEPARAAPFHQAIFEREPTDEDAARGLMRCLARSGDVGGVRKAYKALSEALQRELDDPGARPAPEMRALFVELIAAEQAG
jgi:DNA-binding SARP family transcriptional activator